MRTLIRFSIIVLFLVLGLQAVTAQTSPTRLRLKQLELAPDTLNRYVIIADTSTRVAEWGKLDSLGLGGGSSSFVVDADTGTPQTIATGDTLQINSGWGVNTTVGATGVVTVTGDSTQVATQFDISALHTGSLTAGRIPRATGTYTLGDGVLRDDGTLLALGGVTVAGYSFYDYSTGGWRLATGTTAQQPTGQAGAFRYNTTVGIPEYHNGTRWNYTAPAAGTFTATRIPFANANGQLTDDADFAWDNTNNRVTITKNSATNTPMLSVVNATGTGTARIDFKSNTGTTDSDGASVFFTGSTYTSPYTNAFGFWNYEAGDFAIGLVTEKFRIKTGTGNVGIGTIAPANKLDIEGAAVIGETYSGTNTAPTNGLLVEGNVGIGTNSTSYKLHVSSAASNTAYFTNTLINPADVNRIIVNHLYNSGLSLYNNNSEKWILASYNAISGGNFDFAYYNAQTGINSIVVDGTTDNVGINFPFPIISAPARTLHVNGEARITDLTTDTPTRIVGADADGDLGAITVGSGLSLSAGTLTATGTGTMSSFTIAGSSGTPQTITDGNTATIEAGYGMTTTAAATDKVMVAADTTKLATLYDVTSIGNTLYTGNGTIATDRTVTIGSDKTLTISGTTPDLPGYSFTEEKGYSSDWDTWGNYRLIYTDDYFTNFVQGILNFDSTVFLRISAGDWVGDHFVSMQMDGAGNLSLTGLDDTGTSAGFNLSDNATVGGYGARLQGGAGIEFDTDTGGKFVYQINNSTKMTLDGTGLGLAGSTPAFTLDMEAATDAVDLPGGSTAQRPTNESELLRYNSDNARMEYADGTNWRDLLPATGTTGSAILPSGTTAQRDGSPANGYMRYNSTTGQLEAYVQSAWATVQASPRSYADMISSGAAQYTVVSTEVIDTVTNIVSVGFTHSAGVLTYTGTTGKNFLVNITAVVGEADTDAATAVLRLYQNSSIKGVTQQYCALQDEKYAVSISRIVTLATSDTLDCRLATGGDWIISNFYFNVTPID